MGASAAMKGVTFVGAGLLHTNIVVLSFLLLDIRGRGFKFFVHGLFVVR